MRDQPVPRAHALQPPLQSQQSADAPASEDLFSSRRSVLKGLAAAAGGALVSGIWPTSSRAADSEPVVECSSGKLRGLHVEGVEIFHGVPYADTTAGVNRFMPPQPVKAWAGVRDATLLGGSAPQLRDSPSPLTDWYGALEPLSEDCLSLNVFAPANAPSNAKRAVMVWFHGGSWGSCASTAPGFDGTALARNGDVVVVTVNHRLNVFGYLSFGDHDARFADSGNAGVLDMVAALQWVRNNVARFGGDPSNVTVFGQSGGAAKVSALLALPLARGLFQRAIVQSCSGGLRLEDPTEAIQQGTLFANTLGIKPFDGAALQAVPLDQMLAALKTVKDPFRPVVDGRTFMSHPYDPDAPASAAGVPVLIGNAATEMTLYLAADPRNFDLPEGIVSSRISKLFKIDASETAHIISAYRGTMPSASASEVLSAVSTDYVFRRNTTRIAALQSSHATVYDYVFDWKTPVMNGVLHSPHTVEVPFVFGTTDAAAELIGHGAEIPKLSSTVMSAWVAFAKTGNPNTPALPNWPSYETGRRSTMMLDVESHVETDPGGVARRSLDAIAPYQYNVDRSMVVRDS